MPSKWMQNYMQRQYEDHKKRIREAKSTIVIGKAPEMPVSMRRENERRREQALIEFDNRLLLDRLANAMSRKNIDNELHPQPFTSYIEAQRKRDLRRIGAQNDRMLSRIQNTPPAYQHTDWERDAAKRAEYLRNMSDFPDKLPPHKTKLPAHLAQAHAQLSQSNSSSKLKSNAKNSLSNNTSTHTTGSANTRAQRTETHALEEESERERELERAQSTTEQHTHPTHGHAHFQPYAQPYAHTHSHTHEEEMAHARTNALPPIYRKT